MSRPTPPPTPKDWSCLDNPKKLGAEWVALLATFVNFAFVCVALQQSVKSYHNAFRQTAHIQIEKRRLRYWNALLWLVILGSSIVATVIYFDPKGNTYPRKQVYYTLYFFEFSRDIALTVLMTVFIIRALETNVRVAEAGRRLSKKIKLAFVCIGLTNGISAFICYLLSWLSRNQFFMRGRYQPEGTLRFSKVYLVIRDLMGAMGMAVTAHSIWTVRQSYYESWKKVSANITEELQIEKANRFLKRSLIIVVFCGFSMLLLLSDLISAIPATRRNFPLLCLNPSPFALLAQSIGVWIICSSVYFWLWTGCGIGPRKDDRPRVSATASELTRSHSHEEMQQKLSTELQANSSQESLETTRKVDSQARVMSSSIQSYRTDTD